MASRAEIRRRASYFRKEVKRPMPAVKYELEKRRHFRTAFSHGLSGRDPPPGLVRVLQAGGQEADTCGKNYELEKRHFRTTLSASGNIYFEN
jgi:hypothetical protein